MWVSHAERPLGLDELRHALAVEMDVTDLDPENVRPQDTVLGSCLGLAVVDEETSTVRLIHYTLQEYLLRPDILPDAHKTLAESCLAYLNYQKVEGLSTNKDLNLGDMPFLEYSSLYWGRHAKVKLSDQARSLALELLSRDGNHISASLLVKQIRGSHYCPLSHHLWPGLHCASYFGAVEFVVALMGGEGCDINQSDCMGFTPLMWAAERGNEEVVRLLLTRNDVNPDKPDNDGTTPLWWASYCGHEGAVKLLLARNDVSPDKPNKHGATPLWTASYGGYEGVVKLLLTRNDVNPDRPTNHNQRPLWMASHNGHEGVVKLLLTRNDVDPNRPDNDGETPLWQASYCGHEGVVKLLLARDDVDLNKPDDSGLSPLRVASINRHRHIVALPQPQAISTSVD